MKYKNLLFDLDGTLTDSSEGIFKCIHYAFEKMGYPQPDQSLLQTFIGPPLGGSLVRGGIPESEKERAIKVYRERYNTVGKFENSPYPGMIELLQKLKSEGFMFYVATSKPEKTALEVLDHFDMTKYFDEIAGSTMDGSRETKEDVIKYLQKKIESATDGSDSTTIEKHNTVMIGDTSYDILGAAECGIPTICVGWGFGDKEQMIKDGALTIVNSMDELYAFLHA
jgi:phosphoglycolate phosphatase